MNIDKEQEPKLSDKLHNLGVALIAGFVFFGIWFYLIETVGLLGGIVLGWIPSLLIAILPALIFSFFWSLAELAIKFIQARYV